MFLMKMEMHDNLQSTTCIMHAPKSYTGLSGHLDKQYDRARAEMAAPA